MRTYSVDEVADTIIALARAQEIKISNLKLQKLVYYAQAWNLVLRDKPLFRERIEAWVHGPVAPELFRRFKANGWATICTEVNPVGDKDLRNFLGMILKVYGKYGASQLEELTHAEDPWKKARRNVAPDVPSNVVISHESMKKFYSPSAHGKP